MVQSTQTTRADRHAHFYAKFIVEFSFRLLNFVSYNVLLDENF